MTIKLSNIPRNLVQVTQGINALAINTGANINCFLTKKGTIQVFFKFKANLLSINHSAINAISLSL